MRENTRKLRGLWWVLALILCCSAVFASPMSAAAAEPTVKYADAAFISDYAADAVQTSRNYNLMHGSVIDGEYLFRPLDYVTRQEMFRVVYSLANAGKTDRIPVMEMVTATSVFVDKDEIAPWARSYAGYCISMGLFIGDGSNRLQPRANITYFECALVFLRMLGYAQETLAVQPDETHAEWRARVTDLADGLGLFNGVLYYENGRYDQAIFRQDVAVMIANLLRCKTVTYYLARDQVFYLETGKTFAEHAFGEITEQKGVVMGLTDTHYLLDNGVTLPAPDFKTTDAALLGRCVRYRSATLNPGLSWEGTLVGGETIALVSVQDVECRLDGREASIRVDTTTCTQSLTNSVICVFERDHANAELLTPAAFAELLAQWQQTEATMLLRVIIGADKNVQSVRVIYFG